MQNTPNYNYNLPEYSDSADIAVLNANFSSIDANEYRIEGKLNALGNDIALPYDNTATYSVGDYTIYSNALYRCITAIATAEDFDSTKWTAITIGGELKSHDTRISTLEAGVDLEKSATNSFDDGIDSYFKKVVSTIVPVQAGSGTPSPTNVRAISGFTECTVTDTNGTDTNTATISFGSAGTVYGGYVDLISGKLVVDRGYLEPTEVYQVYQNNGIYYWLVTYELNSVNGVNGLISSHFKSVQSLEAGNTYITNNGVTLIAVPTDQTLNSKALADAWMQANQLQFVYPLATPIEYQLTPAQLRSLVGANRLTSSTCEVTEVEYITNKTIAYVDDKVERYEAQNDIRIRTLDGIKQDNAGFHNSIYRGKFLGTSITAEQYAQISAGTFDDMFIGDYWTISTTFGNTTKNVDYVIAGFNYWWGVGDSYPQSTNRQHIVLVPRESLYDARMNATNTTAGGYTGSEMYTDNLADARTGISSAFSGHLYSVRRMFTKGVGNDGQANSWEWCTSSVDLMSETMVYGCKVWGNSGYEVGCDIGILPLFALNPPSRNIRTTLWLRSVASSSSFARVGGNSDAYYLNASNSRGVCPCFAIYGGN